MKSVKGIIASTLLGLASLSASAAPITVDLGYTGFEYGSKNGTIYNDGDNQGVAAGLFGFDVGNTSGDAPFAWGDNIAAFCVEIDTLLNQGSTSYALLSANDYFGSAGLVNQIGMLYTAFHDDVVNAKTSAAFQLALWELVNEDSTNLSLTTGSFGSTGFHGARDLAQNWLSQLGNIVNGFDLYVLKADDSQDLLVFKPQVPHQVSEPGTLALLALGLAAVCVRMRSSKSPD